MGIQAHPPREKTMPKEIALSQGKIAIVDDSDYEWLIQWKWCLYNCGYAVRNESRKVGHSVILMHSQILRTPQGKCADHVNGNRLDNRRENLRICDFKENSRNSMIRHDNKSGYKGVYWNKTNRSWTTQIAIDGKSFHLGNFQDVKDAALAYDRAAKKLFSEFSKTNQDLGLL
jgi:hypothetical protein